MATRLRLIGPHKEERHDALLDALMDLGISTPAIEATLKAQERYRNNELRKHIFGSLGTALIFAAIGIACLLGSGTVLLRLCSIPCLLMAGIAISAAWDGPKKIKWEIKWFPSASHLRNLSRIPHDMVDDAERIEERLPDAMFHIETCCGDPYLFVSYGETQRCIGEWIEPR